MPRPTVSSSGCGLASGGAGDAAPAAAAPAAAGAAPTAAAAAAPTAAAAAGLAAQGLAEAEWQDGQLPPRPGRPAGAAEPLTATAVEGRRNVKVCIWSAGLRFTDKAELAEHNRDQLVKEAKMCVRTRQAVPTTWPAAFLMSGGWSSSTDVTIAIDTRVFADPGPSSSGRHLGIHGVVLHGLVRSRRLDFRRWFCQKVWCPILHSVAAGPPEVPLTLHVLSFGKSGRHRSVGVAHLIWEVVRQATSWEVQVDHLASSTWWIGTCNNCQECQLADDPLKNDAAAAAMSAAGICRRTFKAWQLRLWQ